MQELKTHLVGGADDRVRGGRDGKHSFFYVFCECFVWGKSEDSYLLLLFFPRAFDGCNIYIIYI